MPSRLMYAELRPACMYVDQSTSVSWLLTALLHSVNDARWSKQHLMIGHGDFALIQTCHILHSTMAYTTLYIKCKARANRGIIIPLLLLHSPRGEWQQASPGRHFALVVLACLEHETRSNTSSRQSQSYNKHIAKAVDKSTHLLWLQTQLFDSIVICSRTRFPGSGLTDIHHQVNVLLQLGSFQ